MMSVYTYAIRERKKIMSLTGINSTQLLFIGLYDRIEMACNLSWFLFL